MLAILNAGRRKSWLFIFVHCVGSGSKLTMSIHSSIFGVMTVENELGYIGNQQTSNKKEI